jgi:hypothetical protein
MAAKDAAQKDKESQKEQIYYSDTYKDVRFIYMFSLKIFVVFRKCTNIVMLFCPRKLQRKYRKDDC